VSPSLLFIQHAGADDYDPTLILGRDAVRDIATFSEAYLEQLHAVIADIFNPAIPFAPTDDSDRCRSCPYATLCGR